MSEIDPHDIMRELGFAGSYSAFVLTEHRGKGVWRMEGESGSFALRILRPDEHETAAAEQRAMDFARAAGTPTPRVLATGTWRRRPVMLLSWCRGQTLREAIRRQPWTAFQLGMACGREQARMHRNSAPPALASAGWITRLGPVDPELSRLLQCVEAARPRLLHLDCHMDNILIARGQVSGIIDWTNACGGDPRADVAWTWSLLTSRFGGGVRARAMAFLGSFVAAGWHRGYKQVAGSQRDMLLFQIWALTGLLHTARAGRERYGTRSDDTMVARRLANMREQAGLSPSPPL